MKVIQVLFFLSFIICSVCSKQSGEVQFYTNSTDSERELSQEQLFNMIRKGVVAIKVNAHLTLNKMVNDNMWHGTGFIVDLEKGLIVTNAHVVGELTVCTYEVKFGNGKTAPAKLEYVDPAYDLAVLSVDKKEIPEYCIALQFSDEPLTLNMPVYSMGNSSRNEFSTYKGYVFDTESILWLKPVAEQSFQFSGLTVPGASGSPVFNSDGKVVGLLYGGKFVSGAALPSCYIKPVIDSLKNERLFKRYFYGCIVDYISIQDAVDSDLLPTIALEEYEQHFPNSSNKVLLVHKKIAAFNEQQNTLKSGDIIWKIEGKLVGSKLTVIDLAIQEKDGKDVNMTVYREGKKKEITVPVSELTVKKKFKLLSFAGTTFFELTEELRITSGHDSNGVFITESEIGSPFNEVTSNDGNRTSGVFKIIEIDSEKITNLDDLINIIPNLLKKNVFKIKFQKIGSDLQISTVISKYSPEFADAKLYVFNNESKIWDVFNIKNPSQK